MPDKQLGHFGNGLRVGIAIVFAALIGTTAAASPTIRVGAVPVAGQTDVHTAQTLGFFEEEGVSVEIVTVRSGAEAQAAVISGNLEFIGVNAVSMIFGLHEGFDFIVAADGFRAPSTPPGTSAIMVRADGQINTPGDLAGKRLGLVSRRGLHEMYLVLWANMHSLDLASVNLVEVGYGQMIDSLISNQVDAIIPLEPFITRGLRDGRVEVLSFYDTEIDPGHANGMWVGMRGFAESHPDAVSGFQRAIFRAHEFLNENPDERHRLTAEWTGLDLDMVLELAPDEFAADMPIQSVQWMADTMLELGWIERELDVTGAFWQQ